MAVARSLGALLGDRLGDRLALLALLPATMHGVVLECRPHTFSVPSFLLLAFASNVSRCGRRG